eukprot:gene34814-45028_t
MNSRVAEFIPSYVTAKGNLPISRSSTYVGDVDGTASALRATSMSSMSGMNLSASEWVPQGKRTLSVGSETVVPTNSITTSYIDQEYPSFVDSGLQLEEQNVEEAYYSPTEKMVEITWNGSVFFVPQDSIAAYPGAEHQTSVLPDEGDAEVDTLFGGDHPLSEAAGDIEPATAANGFGFGSTTVPAPPKRCLQTVGVPEPVREHFQSLDLFSLRQMAPDDARYKEIPPRYHSAQPLDAVSGPNLGVAGAGGSFGYPSAIYKVVDRADSQIYALRRFDSVRNCPPAVVANALGKWVDVRHPSIVSLYGIYIDKLLPMVVAGAVEQEKGKGGALFFSYGFHPAALTLKQRFVDQRGALVGEGLLWRLTVQLLCGVRAVHSRNMAVRVLDPVHVLFTSGACFRINCVGVPDVLEFESRKTLQDMMSEDLVKLARVVLSVATRNIITAKNADEALAALKLHYSEELCGAVQALLGGQYSVSGILALVADRVAEELDTAMTSGDALHSNLRNEYENGRLLRLLFKLGFINERPEYALAPQWAETGDRYVLKLFRDYVFHQTLGSSRVPVLDAGHVLSSLNKLDAGDPEEILLSSRDGKDLLVVTFADVRRCLEKSFVDLTQQADSSSSSTSSQSAVNNIGNVGGGYLLESAAAAAVSSSSLNTPAAFYPWKQPQTQTPQVMLGAGGHAVASNGSGAKTAGLRSSPSYRMYLPLDNNDRNNSMFSGSYPYGPEEVRSSRGVHPPLQSKGLGMPSSYASAAADFDFASAGHPPTYHSYSLSPAAGGLAPPPQQQASSSSSVLSRGGPMMQDQQQPQLSYLQGYAPARLQYSYLQSYPGTGPGPGPGPGPAFGGPTGYVSAVTYDPYAGMQRTPKQHPNAY